MFQELSIAKNIVCPVGLEKDGLEWLLFAECDGIEETGQKGNLSAVRVLCRYDVSQQMGGMLWYGIYPLCDRRNQIIYHTHLAQSLRRITILKT
jgi:hypothetical protein